MADQRAILRGLTILQSYKPDGETWACSVAHDEFFAQGPLPGALGGDDAKELEELLWRWDDSLDTWARFV
ncbi:MAG: hypothetical protein KF850_33080 [Labilithrix sp.]|nr:hypothetical protein [Labilithrix sp.]